jgi:bifunctional DNase/RNase
MSQLKCSVPGCHAQVTAHYVQAEARKIVAQGHLCEEHGASCLYTYFDSNTVGTGTRFRSEDGVAFEPGLVFFHDGRDDRGPITQLTLIEVEGTRRIGMGIGRFEGESLALELQRYKAPRPAPHRAMVALIEALGGHLSYAVVDKFFPAQELAYEAKLHIQQAERSLIVDVRPSDAITLAVNRDVPIFVSDAILEALPKN